MTGACGNIFTINMAAVDSTHFHADASFWTCARYAPSIKQLIVRTGIGQGICSILDIRGANGARGTPQHGLPAGKL